MKIDIRAKNCVYIEIDKHTYYIDNSTNEQIIDKWETNKTNNKLIGGETMIGFNESSPITMQDAIKVVRNYLYQDGFDDYTNVVLTSLIQYLEQQ